jgi:hypothetical protein
MGSEEVSISERQLSIKARVATKDRTTPTGGIPVSGECVARVCRGEGLTGGRNGDPFEWVLRSSVVNQINSPGLFPPAKNDWIPR